jgi:hypothetical protein
MTSFAPSAYKSKTMATWIALLGGCAGLHRFYLYGLRDVWGWVYTLPTLLGVYGVQRMQQLGADDKLAWLLIPLLGLTLAVSMLSAVVYGLRPDERWNSQFNPQGLAHQSSWLTVLGVVTALFVGTTVLMATIAFSAQRYFEHQADSMRTTGVVHVLPADQNVAFLNM